MKNLTQKALVLFLVVVFLFFTIAFIAQTSTDESIVAYGTVGDEYGAPWRLYYDGSLIVESGHINIFWEHPRSPWHNYRGSINKITFTGPITAGEYLRHLFFYLINLTSIEGLYYIDTSSVTDMSYMFGYVRRLENLDLSSWDTRNVTNTSSMFSNMVFLKNLNLNEHFIFDQYTDLPPIPQNNYYTGSWQNIEPHSWVWQMTDAQRADDPVALRSGNVGYNDTQWRLYSDGNLVVESGFITNFYPGRNQNANRSPWYEYRLYINKITFSGPITAGATLCSLFKNLSYTTAIEGLHYFDTSYVRDMFRLFDNMSNLTYLSLYTWDVSNVTNMELMFNNTRNLRNLDLSGWDTRNATNMGSMFQHSGLRQITLGEYFQFIESPHSWRRHAYLPRVPRNNEFAGRWQNVGRGTPYNPRGRFVFTCTELMNNYDGEIHADIWVWQRVGSRQHPTLSGISPEESPLVASETTPTPEGRIYLWEYVGEISRDRANGNSSCHQLPTPVIITSTEGLSDFIELTASRFYGVDDEGNMLFSHVIDITRYDEIFFTTQFLILASSGESSGSNSPNVTAVYTNVGNTIYIEITSTLPGRGLAGTADFAFWWHTIEMDRSLIGNAFVITRERRYWQSFQPLWSFQINTANPSSELPSLVRVNSADELLFYYEKNRNSLPQRMIDTVFYSSRYSTGFFHLNSLVFLRIEEPCDSSNLRITSICSPTGLGVIDVHMTRTISEDNSNEGRFWYFIFSDYQGSTPEVSLFITDEES